MILRHTVRLVLPLGLAAVAATAAGQPAPSAAPAAAPAAAAPAAAPAAAAPTPAAAAPAPAAPASAAPAGDATAPAPAASADWAIASRTLRQQQRASMGEYAPVVNQAGKYQLPIAAAMDAVIADPSLLQPVAIDLGPANTPEERGSIVFNKLQPCSTCHATVATDMAVKLGPRLHGRFGGTAKFVGGSVPFDEAYVHESIKTPLAKISEGFPPVMPPLPLTEEQIADLTAYIKSLK